MRKLSIKGLIIATFALILALALGASVSVLISDRWTREALAHYEQAVSAGGVAATARIAETHRELEQAITLSTRLTLAVRVASFLIGIVLAVVVYRRVAELVSTTAAFAGRIERGEFDTRFVASAGGETAQLASGLNRMVDRLQTAFALEAAARRRLDLLVSSTPMVIYAAKTSGDYGATFISPNIRALLGYQPADFLKDSSFWANNIHPEDRERVLAQQAEVFIAGNIVGEYRFRHQDGSWRWMHDETALVRDEDGKPVEMVGSWFDITRRKALEDSIARRDAILGAVAYGSTRFLRAAEESSLAQWNLAVDAVLSHLGEATGVSRIWVARNSAGPAGDTAARAAHCWGLPAYALSEADLAALPSVSFREAGMAVEALRLRRGEIVELRVRELPEAIRRLLEPLSIRAELLAPIMVENEWWGFMAFDDCVNERSWTESELEALRAAANLFGAAVAARNGRDALRASLESLGSVIEKLKRQSADIERKNAELALANRAKSEFLAVITHELKTPLNSILGFAELLDAGFGGGLPPEQKQQVGEILGAGRQLLTLVSRLLELAQIDTGKRAFLPEATDLGALLDQVATAHGASAATRGIVIEVASAAPTVTLDPRLMRRLLDELIDNAIKFNRPGGRVNLRAALVAAPRAAGGEAESARRDVLHIEVADTGIGIGEADKARLFEAFVQLDSALSRQYGGTGLGLALAQRIAQMHGGRISVVSTPGEGSVFSLEIPQ